MRAKYGSLYNDSLCKQCYAVNKEREIKKTNKKCRKFKQFPAFFGRGSKERSDGIAKNERPGFEGVTETLKAFIYKGFRYSFPVVPQKLLFIFRMSSMPIEIKMRG